jgi:hypothetical protein
MSNYEECCIAKTSEQKDTIKKTEAPVSIHNDFPRINKNKSSIMWFCKK